MRPAAHGNNDNVPTFSAMRAKGEIGLRFERTIPFPGDAEEIPLYAYPPVDASAG